MTAKEYGYWYNILQGPVNNTLREVYAGFPHSRDEFCSIAHDVLLDLAGNHHRERSQRTTKQIKES